MAEQRATQEEIQLAIIKNDIEHIKRSIITIQGELEGKVVKHYQFEPIKNIVYGMVGLILTSFVLAILGLILKG